MKKVLVTGASGTIGKTFCQYLLSKNMEVIPWNRNKTQINDYREMEKFISKVKPDIIYHLAIPSTPSGIENESWLVNYHWTSELAWISKIFNIKFIYTSTVLVFSDKQKGPYTVASLPDRESGYGYEKRVAEERVLYQNPEAIICRLGWQIDNDITSNNMYAHLFKLAQEGPVEASTKWLPSCSFLEDTVRALFSVRRKRPGIYQINSNEKWTYFDIVKALALHTNQKWEIIPTQDFIKDQRMFDERIRITSLEEHLPELEENFLKTIGIQN